MAVSADFLAWVLEQLAGVEQVTSRRMFGGVGIYAAGRFFALVDDDTVYFKVGETNRPQYLARGARPFQPFKDRPEYSMSYYEVPADVLEDRDVLADWARSAIAVAASTSAHRRRKGQRKSKVTRQRRK